MQDEKQYILTDADKRHGVTVQMLKDYDNFYGAAEDDEIIELDLLEDF